MKSKKLTKKQAEIIEEVKKGKEVEFYGASKRVANGLVKSGVLDSFGIGRQTFFTLLTENK